MVILISAHIALALLDLQVADTKGQSVKDSTKKNLTTHLSAYQKFCDRYLIPYFPCDNTVVPVRTTPHQNTQVSRFHWELPLRY